MTLCAERSKPTLSLYYETRGTGTPVLLLHGFGANIFFWRWIVDDLAKDHQVIAIDLKGFGQSPKPLDGKYTLYDQAYLVNEFIIAHDLQHLTLVGHSMGGGVALAAALNLADSGRLDRLVLIDSIAYSQTLPFYIWILSLPIVGTLALKTLPAEYCVKLVLMLAYHDHSLITKDVLQRYAQPLRSEGARHALLRTVQLLLKADVDTLSKRYPSLRLPVLIIWGEKDKIVPIEVAHRLHQAISGSNLVTLSKSGHNPPEEQPKETAQAIRKFVET